MAIYSFIAEERASYDDDWTVAEMCRVLEVSRSGFYGWRNRPTSERERNDRTLAIEIEAIWECSDRTYGAPRTHRWLRKQGFRVGRKRVARIMRANDFEGESGRLKIRTTIVDRGATAASDLVGRDFNPIEPDTTWAGDITYLRTGEGWLFLATVIDLFSRRVIGWSVATHMRTSLVADALEMAVGTRGGHVNDVVFHTDRGSAIHLRRLRRALRRPECYPVHGCHRCLLGQRRSRGLLRNPQTGAGQPAPLDDPNRRPKRPNPLDRRLVQQPPPPLDPRLQQPHRNRRPLLPSR